VTEPLKLIPYYCLNHSSWPLRNNREVTCRLCRVNLVNHLHHRIDNCTSNSHEGESRDKQVTKLLHNILQRFIITNQVFNIKVNGSEFETQRKYTTKQHKQHHTRPSVMPLSTVILPLVLPTRWERTRPRKAIITHIITWKASIKARLSILILSKT
jgi:hypothetical protein